MADEEKKKRPVTLKTIQRAFDEITPEALKAMQTDDIMVLRDHGLPLLMKHVDAECQVRAEKLAKRPANG